MKHKIIIINGPNLNLLGEREKDKYGTITLKKIEEECKRVAKKNSISITFKQSNIEGKIVDFIQEARKKHDALIINAGGYTHTSVAIRDALSLFKKPCIELHISNIYKREEFRQKSLISDVVTGIICGLGTSGYILAINSIYEIIQNGNK